MIGTDQSKQELVVPKYRNSPPGGRCVSDMILALQDKKLTLIDEAARELDLGGLDADYHGVLVHRSDYDPIQLGGDYVAELLLNIDGAVSDERAEAIENGASLNDKEAAVIKEVIYTERAENSGGSFATLWFAEIEDQSGKITAVLAQYEDGSRDFCGFYETHNDYLEELYRSGGDVVGDWQCE